MTERVAVLGGGVAGLTAAHELAERGFEVTVYEARDAPRRQGAQPAGAGLGTGGRADLPAEHGFRFFPGFYKHLPGHDAADPGGSTARRAPRRRRADPARAGRRRARSSIAPAHLPESLDDLAVLARFVFEAATQLGMPPQDHALFVDRLLTLLTSCDERRLGQWELQSWWEFVDAEQRSPAFQKFLADGLTRTLVAARAHEISARTGGLDPAAAAVRPHARRRRAPTACSTAPTSDVWIDPWVAHLRGARRRAAAAARRSRGSTCAAGAITGVTRRRRDGHRRPLRRRAAGRGDAAARRRRRCAPPSRG